MIGKGSGFLKFPRSPVTSYIEVTGNLLTIIEMTKQVAKEPVAYLTEKSPDDHVELIQHGLLLPVGEDALNHDDYEEHLKGQKSQVTK